MSKEIQNSFEDLSELVGAIEALLFIYGEPMKIKKLAELSGTEEKNVKEALLLLGEKMKETGRGLNLVVLDDKATLSTKQEFSNLVKKVVKEELDSDLTPASLETLAIVAYLGPVSRTHIDYIRGVNSSFILRNLMVRGLVSRETDKNEQTGFLYNITFDFFKHIGINSQEELPDFSKYRDIIKGFSQETNK